MLGAHHGQTPSSKASCANLICGDAVVTMRMRDSVMPTPVPPGTVVNRVSMSVWRERVRGAVKRRRGGV